MLSCLEIKIEGGLLWVFFFISNKIGKDVVLYSGKIIIFGVFTFKATYAKLPGYKLMCIIFFIAEYTRVHVG